jgi:hypothetical protein
MQKIDHLLAGSNRRIAEAHPHTSEAESRDFQTTISKFTPLHFYHSYP